MGQIGCKIGNINVSNKPPNVVKTALKSINSGSYLLRYKWLNRWLYDYVQIGNEVQYEKPKSHFWRQKKGLIWNDFEWIWMVRNEPCLNIFVTKTQQIRFNPAQSTKPAGSSWIFNNVQDLIFAEPPWNILESSIKYFWKLKIWDTSR